MKEYYDLSPKLIVEATQERADIRFLIEVITVSRFSETSSFITQAQMNSEISSKKKAMVLGSNMNNDTTLTLKRAFSFDVKSGDNM